MLVSSTLQMKWAWVDKYSIAGTFNLHWSSQIMWTTQCHLSYCSTVIWPFFIVAWAVKTLPFYLIPEACCFSPIIPNNYLLSSYCYTLPNTFLRVTASFLLIPLLFYKTEWVPQFLVALFWVNNLLTLESDWLAASHKAERERRNGCWGTVTSRGCAHQKPLFHQL